MPGQIVLFRPPKRECSVHCACWRHLQGELRRLAYLLRRAEAEKLAALAARDAVQAQVDWLLAEMQDATEGE